jgi:hypothetical protein
MQYFIIKFLSGIFKILRRFFRNTDYSSKQDPNNYLVLRPDGSWIVTSSDQLSNNIINPPIQNRSPSYQPYYRKTESPLLDKPGEIMNSPSFYPHKKELCENLDKCMSCDVVSSCSHHITDEMTYVLKIEIPCLDDYNKSIDQLNKFCKLMEQKYEFDKVQQERVLSKTSTAKYHFVCFEYDPRRKLFK